MFISQFLNNLRQPPKDHPWLAKPMNQISEHDFINNVATSSNSKWIRKSTTQSWNKIGQGMQIMQKMIHTNHQH